jgi:hypothetical protein
MASPFAIFRKNQRLWMAAAVFIAVVAFVISPAIESFSNASRSNGSGGNPLMASWTGGSIYRDQMEREYYELRMANAFLRKLAMEVRAKGGTPNVPGVAPDLSQLGITGDAEPPVQIVQRKLLAAEAKRRGIVFDDASVQTFLKRFVDGKLDGVQIEKALKESTEGRLTWFDFNQLMTEEMAKNEVLQLGSAGLRFEDRRNSAVVARPALSTPGKNWQDYLRFNQASKIQAFPVFAKDYESQVQGKPTEREIQDLYQEGKDVTRMATTIPTQPAFLRPKTADFEYLSLDVEKVITEQIALIPEDTLRAEYARRVEEKQFRVPVTPEATSTVLPDSIPGTPAPTSTPAPESPAAAVPTATEQKPAPESKPAAEPATATQPEKEPAVEPDAVPESKPAAESPAVPEPKPASESPAPVAPAEKPTAFQPRLDSNVRLVSFQEEKPQEPAPTSTPETPAATTPAATTVEPQAETKPGETKPTSSIELSEAVPPQATLPGQAGEPTVAESTPMRTKTFEEVKDQIAREQASAAAFKIVDDRLNLVLEPMNIYAAELSNYQNAVAMKDKSAKPPTRPDLKKLFESKGFEYGTTGMVDTDTVQLTPIGSAFVMSGQGQQPFQFPVLINNPIGELFTPFLARGFTGGFQNYVVWKTEETLPITPSLDSVRDQIIEVWKKQQAFKLAETRARELADKVGTAALADALATPEEKALILEPANFTWFNPMFARMESRMQLSTVELLQPVDNRFMEAVFACKPGDTTFAPDTNKTICYVVKVVEMTPDIDSLLERFAAAPLEGVATVSRIESDNAIQPWFQNLQKQLGFRMD